MKKIITLLLTLAVVCCLFAGCGAKAPTGSVADTSSNVASNEGTFQKPENYATVVNVKINPEFNLYIDENGFVLAVEPLNEDAKTISITVTTENKEITKLIGELVTKTKEKGFLKNDATVKVETEKQEKLSDKVKETVSKVKQAFETATKETGITVTVEVSDKKSEGTSSENTTSKNEETSSKNEETSSSAPVKKEIAFGKEYYCFIETSNTTVDKVSLFFKNDGTSEYLLNGYQDTNPNAGTEYDTMGTKVSYKSKTYYNCAGLGDDGTYVLDGDKILITDSSGKEQIELVIESADKLIVNKFGYYNLSANSFFTKADAPLDKPIAD